MNLLQLKPGQKAVIIDCHEEKLPLKLMEMGCIKGVEVEFLYQAPLGTPLYYKIGGMRIALDKDIASQIEVEPVKFIHAKS